MLLSLYLTLIQLIVGTIVVYAQAPSSYRFSSQKGVFDSGVVATPTPASQRSFETELAITVDHVDQTREDIINLRSQIAVITAASLSLEKRLVVLENVHEITSKILNLSYGMIISIGVGLIIAIVNIRIQGKRRQPMSKEDLRAVIEEITKSQPSTNFKD